MHRPQDETDELLGELAYSPMFRLFVEHIVRPEIEDVRAALIRDTALTEPQRIGKQTFLLKVERMLDSIYERTEGRETPDWIQKIFR